MEYVDRLIQKLRGPSAKVRREACEEIEKLRAEGKPAFSDLVRILDDRDATLRCAALKALAAVGLTPDIEDRFLKLVDDPSSGVRYAALDALQYLGKGRQTEVIAALTRALENQDRRIQRLAAFRLASFGAAAAGAIRALATLLDHADDQVRGPAAFAVPQLGPTAAPWLSQVIALFEDRQVDTDAVDGIIRRGDAASREALIAGLRSSSEWTRAACARALLAAQVEPELALETLIEVLGEGNSKAAEGLLELEGPAVLPRLLDALAYGPEKVRAEVAKLLGKPKDRSGVIAALANALEDPASNVRHNAAMALRTAGALALPAVPALTRCLHDPVGYVRRAADAALREVSPERGWSPWDRDPKLAKETERSIARMKKREHLPQLIALLRADNPDLRDAAALALGKLGSAAAPATAALIRALGDSSLSVCDDAAAALGAIGESTPEGINALRSALQDPAVAYEAARSLASLGPQNLPLLLPLSEHSHDRIRLEVVQTMGTWGIQPEVCVPALAARLQDKDFGVRRAALQALTAYPTAAVAAAPALIDAWDDEDFDLLRKELATLLASLIDRDDARILAALVDARPSVRHGAALFAASGPLRPQAIDCLKSLLGAEDPDVQHSATYAVAQVDPPPLELLSSVLAIWNDETQHGVKTALKAFGPDAYPQIAALLDSPDAFARLRAAEFLYVAEVERPRSLEVLIAGLNDPDPRIHTAAARHVSHFRPAPEAAAEPLFHILVTGDRDAAHWAADSLRRLGPNAQEILPRLAELFGDDLRREQVYGILEDLDRELLGRLWNEADKREPVGPQPKESDMKRAARVVRVEAHDDEAECFSRLDPTWEEIEPLIARLGGKRFPFVYLELHTAETMFVESGVFESCFTCRAGNGSHEAYLVDPSRRQELEDGEDEPIVLVMAGGQITEIPRSWTTSRERVLQAARHFYSTGKRDPSLEWIDLGY